MSPTRASSPQEDVKPSDPNAAKRIIEEAMKQPGVRDLMEAYGDAKRYQDAAAAYQTVLATRTIEWASDSTGPESG